MAKRSSRRQLSFSGGDDDLCKLCQCHNSHLSSPASWRNEQARSHVLSLQVPPDSLVCRPCRHDVTRVLANPCYVPRWRKGKTSAKNSTCCILGCRSVTLSAVGSTSEVHHAFESMGLKCSSEVIPTPTPLCKYHYHLTYNALQPRECATCGTRLRGNNHRPCPKPDVIQEHLRERTGFEGEIHSQDRVCITCYKSHLVVLKADPQCVSRDNDLKQLVSTYTKQMPAIQRGATSSDVIKAAMARTVVHVGNILLQNQAILLPTIHSVFTSYITDLLKGTDIGIEDIGHISSRWVLSDLTTSLQHHITYSCKIRKYGTLVYRLGADLTPSLSEALWRLRSTETSTNEPKAPDGPATCSRDLDHINKLVHKQIANFLAQDAHSPFEHDEVNFDDLITQIDPELWNIVCTLTKSKSENRGTSKVTDPLSPAYHVKRIRRLFLICIILFCTDDRCSMPLHTLLTDTVESQGGSALLVQILNRLGVCASSDTLSRFIQYQVSKDKPDVKYLKPDTFTLISADNIDFMHSFARVYCGHQTSSWHGTTVQAAQPLPSLSLPEMDPSSVSLLPAPMDPSQIGRPATCPNMDPSPVGLKPAPMNPSQIGPPATSPTMDPSYVGLKPAPMNPSQIGPPATSPTMDPSYVGLKPAPMNPSQRGPPATCPTMDPSYVGLKPAPMNPSQRGPPATSPTMDPSYVGLKPAPMNPSQIGPPATSPTMDPSYVGLKPAPMNPSPRGPPATCPTMDPSYVGLKPAPMNPSQRGPPATCPNMDPSYVGLKPAPMNPSQIGPPATSPTMDPSYVGLKPAPMNPSQIGPPATSPTMDPSYVGLKPAPMNPSQIGPPATSPTMDPSYVGLKPAPMNPSPRGPPATCPTMDPSYVGLKPAPMNPSQRGPPAQCPNMDPSYVGLKPAPMNPSQIGPPATSPTMDPSYVGLKPAPMNPSPRGPPATCPTMDPSYVGLKPAPMNPSQRGPPATCPNMDPSYVGLKPTPMNPSQRGPPATSPTMDPSYVGLKPAPMNPSQRGPPATCPNMDPSYVGLKPAPMNPSQIGPPATSPTMDPSYVGLKPAPMNPSPRGPPATCPTMDPSYVGLKPAPMNPSQIGPPATSPTMDPSYVGLKPAPMNPSPRGPPATCPTMDPSYVGLKPAPMNPSHIGPPATSPTMDPSYVGLKPAPMNPSQIGPPATYSHTMSVLSRKRTERSSPIHSPMKLTRSPLAKVQRRLRTGTERQKQQAKSQAPELAHGHSSHHSSLSLSDFLMSERETDALVDLQKDLDSYILHRVAISTSTSQKPFLNIQDFFSCIRVTHTEKSQIVYLEVMDSIADRKDTVMQLLHDLHQRFIADKDMQWLVLEGDAKLYEIMKSLQFEYGDELSWVIPYPGDWHMLMNYQSALMKAYYDAGLKALARAAGYPLAAIQNSSQFKRSHNFILEVWEAIYRVMLERYIESKGKETTTKPSLLEDIASHLQSLSATDLSHTLNTALPTFCTQTRNHFNNFKSFIQVLARTDDTWRFWVQFVFQDAMAYIGLFLAIRSGDWQLRMASMKSMAALFTAFDHPTYQKLISQHLADILTMPTPIVTMFQQGAFVVSILGRPWHSVAIDESHEMLINKDCKSSVVRPLPDYINRIAHYMPYRSKSVKNFQLQLFPTKKDQYTIIKSPLSSNPSDIKCNHNIQAQIQVIETNKLLILTDTNRGLINPFTKKEATAGQHHDLLNFRSVGQQEFLLRISSVILKQPSVHAPNRRRRLQTFSERKVNKSRITQLEKDKKLIMSAMKKKIQFSRKIGRAIETPGEQLIELPLAISDNAGNLLKGQKSYTSKCLESRYKSANPQVFLTNLPWTPHCTLLEGMFLINTNPLGSHKTLGDYAKFIMTRFLLMQFKRGSREVHVLFDNPGRLKNTPKYFEHMRRDAAAKLADDHCCDTFTTTTKIPKKWREGLLNCRECKRSLVKFLTQYFLDNIHTHLQDDETLYVAGGFDGILTDTAWYVKGNGRRQPHPAYTCNAEETDTRVWLHVKQTEYRNILLLSPDTDIYHIGMALENAHDKEVIIQISPINSRQIKYLNLRALITAFRNDPDLVNIDDSILPQVFQTLFVCTGTDYTSFFSQIGKATFLRYFFQHAAFITGRNSTGTLADTSLEEASCNTGFLAFMRLIGTVYFKKHATCFETPSPVSHYLKFVNTGTSTKLHHENWLDDIRQSIWHRISFENEMVPSNEALFFHWKRSCWIMHMWSQGDRNTMYLQPLTEHGWSVSEGTLSVVWDTQRNMQAIRERVSLLLRGCKCITGCSTGRCSCRRSHRECAEGCLCVNCSNITVVSRNDDSNSELAEIALEEVAVDDDENNTEELMDWIFGPEMEGSESDEDS